MDRERTACWGLAPVFAALAVAACNTDSLPTSMADSAARDHAVVYQSVDLYVAEPDLAEAPDIGVDPCADRTLDGMETDVDCGGPQCGGCVDGKRCMLDRDCIHNDCRRGICRPATSCRNGVRDGQETDIDCGGSDCACPHCAKGKACMIDNDCQSGLCSHGRCAGPSPLTLRFAAPLLLTTGAHPRNLAVGDWNGDGGLDLAGASDDGPLRVYLGVGDGTFNEGAPISTIAEDLWAADFNRDGNLDLAACAGEAAGVAVYLGAGDGTFGGATVTPTPGAINVYSMTAGDLNGDGKPDLFLPDWGGAARVLLGDGQGGFQVNVSMMDPFQPATRVRIADLDCDGKSDIYQANNEVLGIWIGDGKGGFAKSVGYPWFGMGEGAFSSLLAYDLDRDGILDVVDSYGSVLVGKGNGTFGLAGHFPEPPNGFYRGLAIADFDRDGNVDAAVGDSMGPLIHVYPGTGPGTFGAEVTAPAGRSTQTIAAMGGGGRGAREDWRELRLVRRFRRTPIRC